MTSPSADSHASINATQNESEPIEASHPEPAFQEAQEWIEAVTGRSFGDMGFRSGLENGILLCELLSAIKPGLVKKINRLPTPIAGLDNLTVFLRGCEELGLNGSQLFDPGDLQDTSIRANLKDADCNRKLKNVLNTVFWLGKAANSCTSYSGPTLNLKEFEELLAQMRMGCEAMGDTGALTVRDSGYDCWDSERSESLSSPCHTRDNSLDSLDSFGSHSQQSPSPDVINRLNSDGRGSDSEAEGKKPDMRRDDMLARRTASSESRAPVPFNQFLPNRTNATAYVPAPRRRAHGEEGEQRRSMSMGDMPTEEEAMGSVPPLNQSRFERTHETLHNFEEEDDGWQDNLARWKNRRRSASQELIKKEEERKRIEKRMKENGVESGKRKSIKTYKEIVEEKEKREIDLCESYRRAQTPEEAAMVLQRYALRFTISDATLDSLKLPRSTSPNTTPADPDQKDREPHPPPQSTHPPSETPEPPHLRPDPARMTEQHPTPQENEGEEGVPEARSSPTPPGSSTGHVGRPRPSLPPRPAPSELRPHQPPQGEPRGTPHTPPGTGEAQPGQTKGFRPQPAREDLESAKTVRVHHVSPTPYPPSKPVPLLTAKPYCLPGSSHSARKSVLLDGLVRVNGNVKEESKLSSTPASSTSTLMENPASSVSPPHSTEEKKEDTASFSPPQSPKQEKEEPASVSPPPSTEEKKEPAPSSTPLSSQEEKKEPVSSFSPPHSPKPAVQKPATFSPPQSPHKEKEVAASSFSPPQSPEQEKQDTVSSFSPPQSPEQDRQDTVSSFSPPLSPKREKEEPVPSFSPPLSPKQEKEEPVPSFSPPLSPKQEKEEPVPSFSPPLSPKREGEKPATFSPPLSPHKEKEDPASEQTAADSQRTASDQPTTESRGSHSGSAMSALIGGRNCIITTTIVTELTQTVVETIAMETDTDGSVNGTTERFDSSTEEREPAPAALPLPSSLPLTPLSPFTPLSPLSPLSSLSPISPLPTNGQMYSPTISEGIQESSSTIETPMLNLAKRVNHWVWDPNEERKRQERWQREQERLLQEQYQKEQEKLKGEWERAQKEVEEEERRHNEEERRILDETATPLNPSGLAKPPRPAPEEEGSRPAQPNHQTLGRAAHAEPHIQRPTTTNEDQHKSKLHFFQESSQDSEASRKHDLWKTSSLDRNTQLLQSNTVKRSGSDNTVAGSQQPPSSSSQPPSPSRCVSGKRLCSGCSQPLGKGAAMIIDTMGLFFHLPCFKCGVCSGQMGDTSTGTDVRIRNGHLTCNECYIATRGGGQPTTL
uniref:LIM and calponin homology domains-containing protein 1-like n=1 Tax=Gadus morhua TaxID=8049 RepID=A0A8C5F3N0_GADMO